MIGLIKVSRSIKELIIKIKEVEKEYLIKTGQEITIDKIASKLKVSKEEIALAMESQTKVKSIDEEIYEDSNSGESRINQIKDEKDEEELIVNKIFIKKAIQDLEERERKIILLRYYQNRTQSEVAKILGISQVQVSRIEKKILLLMREKIRI